MTSSSRRISWGDSAPTNGQWEGVPLQCAGQLPTEVSLPLFLKMCAGGAYGCNKLAAFIGYIYAVEAVAFAIL